MNQFLSVEHREHITDNPHEQVVAAFNEATGNVEERFALVASEAKSDLDFPKISKNAKVPVVSCGSLSSTTELG